MVEIGLRSRVTRLLKRTAFKADDLTMLFLHVRDRCEGHEAVREIGDFVAHRNVKTKGLVTSAANDFFTIIRYHTPRMIDPELEKIGYPQNIKEVCHATLRRLPKKDIKKSLDLNKASTLRILNSALEKMIEQDDGTMIFSHQITKSERNVLKLILGTIPIYPAFSSEDLFNQFCARLLKLDLLHQNEVLSFEKLKHTIVLYAVCIMNNCRILLSEEDYAVLEAGVNTDGKIRVNALAHVHRRGNDGDIWASHCMFKTNLDAKDYCDNDLVELGKYFKCELELTDFDRLSILT